MKRVLSIALSVLIVFSTLCCMVSCDEKVTPIDSINGMSAAEACDLGLERLSEKERYYVSVDAELRLNVLVATIPVGIEDFYVNTTDGEDMHYKFTDEDLLFIDNAQLLSIFSGYDKEVWYVDGVRYGISQEGIMKVDESGRKPSNVVDKIIEAITSADNSGAQCYEQGGEQYILMTVTLEEFEAGEVDCKIYVDGNGDITRAVVEGALFGVGVSLTMNFEYDDVPEIVAPEV